MEIKNVEFMGFSIISIGEWRFKYDNKMFEEREIRIEIRKLIFMGII